MKRISTRLVRVLVFMIVMLFLLWVSIMLFGCSPSSPAVSQREMDLRFAALLRDSDNERQWISKRLTALSDRDDKMASKEDVKSLDDRMDVSDRSQANFDGKLWMLGTGGGLALTLLGLLAAWNRRPALIRNEVMARDG